MIATLFILTGTFGALNQKPAHGQNPVRASVPIQRMKVLLNDNAMQKLLKERYNARLSVLAETFAPSDKRIAKGAPVDLVELAGELARAALALELSSKDKLSLLGEIAKFIEPQMVLIGNNPEPIIQLYKANVVSLEIQIEILKLKSQIEK